MDEFVAVFFMVKAIAQSNATDAVIEGYLRDELPELGRINPLKPFDVAGTCNGEALNRLLNATGDAP